MENLDERGRGDVKILADKLAGKRPQGKIRRKYGILFCWIAKKINEKLDLLGSKYGLCEGSREFAIGSLDSAISGYLYV